MLVNYTSAMNHLNKINSRIKTIRNNPESLLQKDCAQEILDIIKEIKRLRTSITSEKMRFQCDIIRKDLSKMMSDKNSNIKRIHTIEDCIRYIDIIKTES